MKSKDEIEELERLIGQLNALYGEISQLAKKSPNDGLNSFKLGLVNKILGSANGVLTGRYRPFEDFDQFSSDDLPSTSDVTMVLAQYMEQIERLRSDNVMFDRGKWVYQIEGQISDVPSRAPTRSGADRK